MSLDFEMVERDLPTTLAGLMGGDVQVSWWELPRTHHKGRDSQGKRIELRLAGLVETGMGDEVATFDATACAGEEMRRCVAENAELTIQAEAWTLKQGLGSNALRLVHELASKLRCEDSIILLEPLGLAFQGSGPPASVPETVNGRRRIRWSLPLTFGCVVAFDTAPTTYIESATVTGTLDADGDLGIAVTCEADSTP